MKTVIRESLVSLEGCEAKKRGKEWVCAIYVSFLEQYNITSKVDFSRRISSATMSISTSLRNYQREAIEMAKKSNTLVVLPTGSGKTQISAAVIQHHIIAIATSSTLGRRRALFLTPTVLLVRQQANVLRDELKDHKVLIAEYIGGKAPPPPLFHVLVTTPGAFLNVIDTARHFELGDYAHITFDEVHHMTGDHPYTSIAGYLYSIQDIAPPVLGLTASLTYAQSSLQIHKRIQEMCAVLRVSKENIYYTTENTLRHDGFHAVKAGVTKVATFL